MVVECVHISRIKVGDAKKECWVRGELRIVEYKLNKV